MRDYSTFIRCPVCAECCIHGDRAMREHVVEAHRITDVRSLWQVPQRSRAAVQQWLRIA